MNKEFKSEEEYRSYLSKISNFCDYLEEEHSIDDIFREIHSLKSLTYYYNLTEISILLEKTENILMFLRNYECNIKCISEWILELQSQLSTWVIQLNNDQELEMFSLFFDDMPEVTCKRFKAKKLNKNTEILIIHKEHKIQKLIYDVFSTNFKFIKVLDNIEDAYTQMSSATHSYLITSIKYNKGNVLQLINKLKDTKTNLDDIHVLGTFALKKDYDKFKTAIGIKNIYDLKHSKISDIKESINKELQPQMDKVKIPDNKITLVELSKLIKPLSETVITLEKKCFDDNISVNDISGIIKKDPMFSGLLLKSINTPFMGLPNRVSNINIAVSLMGKKRVGTMVLQELSKNMFQEEFLEAYNISLDSLLQISMKRTLFVNEWIKYIDMPQKNKDDIVSLMCLLPIGNIIINQALIHNNDAKRFSTTFDSSEPHLAERQMLGYSAHEALERLFEIWNMPKQLSNILHSVREYGVQSVNYMNMYSIILTLSTQMFRLDGTFSITNNHIRYANKKGLASTDMKNIFLKMTNNRINGSLESL